MTRVVISIDAKRCTVEAVEVSIARHSELECDGAPGPCAVGCCGGETLAWVENEVNENVGDEVVETNVKIDDVYKELEHALQST